MSTHKQTITKIQPEYVTLELLDGFEATGEFRSPNKGEWFIGDGDTRQTDELQSNGGTYGERYILRKIGPEIRTQYLNIYADGAISRQLHDSVSTADFAASMSSTRRKAIATVTYEVPRKAA